MTNDKKIPNLLHENNVIKDGMPDDGYPTLTSVEQEKVELSVCACFQSDVEFDNLFDREATIIYLIKGLFNFPQSYQSLDASRPWLVYWIVHSLELLDYKIPIEIQKKVIILLKTCEDRDIGGYGGGPGWQLPHLATTYAAVMALCSLRNLEAFKTIDRRKILAFLQLLHQEDGSFVMHVGGEVDIRGAYCALAIASILNLCLPQHLDNLFPKTASWIAKCQTFEGGFAASPGVEAHGGYTFCGLAALTLIERLSLCNIQLLLRRSVFRQMNFEGGFQGRCNKLVDACYSWWQGGVFPILHNVLQSFRQPWLFNADALRRYLLCCSQLPDGGFRDKPTARRDYYHTCYALSGLSVAQNLPEDFAFEQRSDEINSQHLLPVNSLYNISARAANTSKLFFVNQPFLFSGNPKS